MIEEYLMQQDCSDTLSGGKKTSYQTLNMELICVCVYVVCVCVYKARLHSRY